MVPTCDLTHPVQFTNDDAHTGEVFQRLLGDGCSARPTATPVETQLRENSREQQLLRDEVTRRAPSPGGK